ncbi:MAG: hypothetical protein Q4A26_03050 [Candidatus Saccharibacteria bacterium]|nr:hypothetical protein [Candidatus Saccharibacteria bacterium]
MTVKSGYNPIESVAALALKINDIKQAYGEDAKRIQPGIVSYRSLAILNPFMDICMEKYEEVLEKKRNRNHGLESQIVLENARVMKYDFENLQQFLRMDSTLSYGYSRDDYIDHCHALLNQLRSSIECVVFYPNVCIGRLVQDAA